MHIYPIFCGKNPRENYVSQVMNAGVLFTVSFHQHALGLVFQSVEHSVMDHDSSLVKTHSITSTSKFNTGKLLYYMRGYLLTRVKCQDVNRKNGA